jgi:ABC-type lipoprotein release transport system permease subunit
VGAHDAATFAAVTAFLLLTAFLASYLPALRATRVDPLVVLRDE